jgi:hypothetical protein
MTKVAGIPGELRALASTLVTSTPELELAAATLGAAAVPEMPPGVSSQVEEAILRAQALLRDSARTASEEAQDLRRRGLWFEIADRAAGSREAASTLFGMVTTPLDATDGFYRWRLATLLEKWAEYRADVLSVATTRGESSLPTLDAYLRFQETHPMSPQTFETMVDGAGSIDNYVASLGRLAQVVDVLGRYAPYAAIPAGVVSLVRPQHAHGILMAADRGAGLATIGGSVGSIAMSAGLLEVTPLGVGVVTVLLVGAGVYELYENREEVARLTVAGGKFLLHHAYVLAGPEGIVDHEIFAHRAALARAAVTSVDAGKDFAEKGAATILHGVTSGGESVVHGGASEGKKILGHLGGGIWH